MSTRNNPPRQSAVARKRRPVTAHNETPSVGHQIGTGKSKTINDPKNGQAGNGSRPVTTEA